ncbi:MAG: hypothetical protein ACOC5K_05160, partial [Chloroflexota bacterium]
MKRTGKPGKLRMAFMATVALLALSALAACGTFATNEAPADSVDPTPTSAPQPTETPAPQAQQDGVHTPEDLRRQYEEWPEEHKVAVDEDVVVR